MQFPILSVIVLTPIITGMLILLVPKDRKDIVRYLALTAAIVDLALSVWVYFNYQILTGGYQVVE
jgi:NADH:ubiquinone oxidoreductase subunit 4 (subunit M)